MGLKEKIFAAKDLDFEPMIIPEWDCTIFVRGMSARERARVLQRNVLSDGRANLEGLYPQIVMAIAHEKTPDGQFVKIFDDEDDAIKIGGKNGAIIERIATWAMGQSGMSQGAVDEAKNSSKTTPSGEST